MSDSEIPVFTIARHFTAPLERVYAAFADPEKMAHWSGPKGSTYHLVSGEVAEGKTSIAGITSGPAPDMLTLCLWRELRRPSRVPLTHGRTKSRRFDKGKDSEP